MPRAVSGIVRHKRQKKILKMAKGYYGRRSKLFKTAKESVFRALAYAYRDRRRRKRDFRRLWIVRINAGLKQLGLKYSLFINALTKSNIQLNRKVLAYIAVEDFDAFKSIVEEAKKNMKK